MASAAQIQNLLDSIHKPEPIAPAPVPAHDGQAEFDKEFADLFPENKGEVSVQTSVPEPQPVSHSETAVIEEPEDEDVIARERAAFRARVAAKKEKAAAKPVVVAAHPPELAPLITSGKVVWDEERGYWREPCKEEEIGKVPPLTRSYDPTILTFFGRKLVGLATESVPKPRTPEDIIRSWEESSWYPQFRGMDELADSGVRMYIENFLPEGITFICGLPKEGKSWLALSISKALTEGKPLFGRAGFEVPEAVPVLYLAAEVSDGAFKARARKFGLTSDKTKFLCRTLTQGVMSLKDHNLEGCVRDLKPVVVLDVLQCFNYVEDENDAAANRELRQMASALLRAGAKAIIILHHSTKDLKKGEPTKEKAVRGNGDLLAMADLIWAVLRDDRLYKTGVEEIEVMGWGREFPPPSIRLALTEKAPKDKLITYRPGILSCIDEYGDLKWVDRVAAREAAKIAVTEVGDTLERLVEEDPTATLKALAERTGETTWVINSTLRDRGWSKPSGRPKKNQPNRWEKKKP